MTRCWFCGPVIRTASRLIGKVGQKGRPACVSCTRRLMTAPTDLCIRPIATHWERLELVP